MHVGDTLEVNLHGWWLLLLLLSTEESNKKCLDWTSSWKLEFLGCLGHPYTSSLANHYCDGGSSLNSQGLDWTSPWTQKMCWRKGIQRFGFIQLKHIDSSWKSMVFNCCPTWVLFLQMPWNQSPPQFRPRRVPKCFFAASRRGFFKLSPFNAGFGGSHRRCFFSGGKDPLKWQIDTGEGFLRDAPDDAMGDMMGSGMALAKATVFWRGTRKNVVMKCDLRWCDSLFNGQMVWYEFFSKIGDIESCSVLGNLAWNPFQFSHIGVFTIPFQTNFDCTYPKQMMFQKMSILPYSVHPSLT